MTTEKPEKGDKVSWNWGGGAPGGTVAETKDEGSIAIKSKRGNTIKKNASPDNPAVHIARSGNDVVKRASELTVESKASSNGKTKNGGNANASGKRKAESQGDDNEKEEAKDAGNPHTINEDGKEVKNGGKEANKKQKVRRGGDVKDKGDGSETSEDKNGNSGDEDEDEEEDGDEDGEKERGEKREGEEENEDEAEKPKQTNGDKKFTTVEKEGQNNSPGRHQSEVKDSAPRGHDDEDLVSARTRSHDKAA